MQELLKLEEAAHVYLEDASEENEKKMEALRSKDQ